MTFSESTSTRIAIAGFILALVLLAGAEARSAPLVAQSFGFMHAPGRGEEFTDLGTSPPSADTAAKLQARYPSIGEVQLYCTPFSGPRFAYIDGTFYNLNQKARREGAYVSTSEGRKELLDIDKPPSPIAGDFLLILNLDRDAGEAC
ncbi:MAG TPA: hypothetical protein VGO22_17165 [Pseudorhizobium sp.]|nr:hypothetical protein [Pseudorhizobium sp.]